MAEAAHSIARIDAALEKLALRLVCPACRGELSRGLDFYNCAPCRRRYPVVAGIPDFRIRADRFISAENDIAKGLRALELSGGTSFETALDAYWSITPELAPNLARKHQAHQLRESEIGNFTLNEIERVGAGDLTEKKLIDLGCQTAGLVAAAARRCQGVVGIDVALRWLLIGKLRLRDAGVDAPLICAAAEYLPFESAQFDIANASDLLEHVTDPAPVLREAARALAPGGLAYIATNNRYSLLPEPHVRLMGVGWLPRKWQRRYVWRRLGHTYEHVLLLSGEELTRLAREAGLDATPVAAAPQWSAAMPSATRWAVGVYEKLRYGSRLSGALSRVAPRIQIVGRPPSDNLAKPQSSLEP